MSTPPTPAPDLVDRLGAELAEVARRVESIRHDLGALRTASPPGPSTPAPWSAASPPAGSPSAGSPSAAPPTVSASVWRPPTYATPTAGWAPPATAAPHPAPPQAGPQEQPAQQTGPPQSAPPQSGRLFPGQQPPGPPRPGPPRPGLWPSGPAPAPRGETDSRTSAGTVARLLAITGAGVTLLGVVLLLVLAASRGWFSPGARVAGGAILGMALAGAGIRVHRRTDTEAASSGAVALVGTGVAALYLTVAAASALYAFLPVVPALLLALLVTGAGLALADRWRHRGLALGVLAGGDLLVPFVVGKASPLLVALLLAAGIAALPVALRRDWTPVAALAVLGAAVGGLAAGVRVAVTAVDRPVTAVAVLAVLVVGAVAVVLRTRRDPAVSPGPAAALASCALGAPLFAVLVLALALPRTGGALVAVLGAVLLLVTVVVLDRADRPDTRAVALVAGGGAAVALLVATVLAISGNAGLLGLALLGEALVLLVLADRTGRRLVLAAAGVFGLAGLVSALAEDLPLRLLVDFPARGFVVAVPGSTDRYTALVGPLAGAVGVAMMLVALGVGALAVLARLGLLSDASRRALAAGGLGLVALYGATGTVLALALLVSPSRGGFLAGHVLVTVSWTAVALVLLARGLRASLPRVLGGVLVVAAVAKLILFDLTALDGIARVAAFLGAGIVLLVAGARYARALADDAADTSAASSSRVGPDGTGERHPDA